MFRLEMLPAAHGDCLWIEYGSKQTIHRILIDGGPAHTYPALRERILFLPEDGRNFDLLVITHIDADHIEGIIRLLQDAEKLNCHFERIWFNGRDQLNKVPDPAGEPLGALQGEYLGILIGDYEDRVKRHVWNTDFANGVATIESVDSGLRPIPLPGECRVTLLSPDEEHLLELKDNWREELKIAGVVSGDEDTLRRNLAESRYLQPLGDELGAEDEPAEDRFEVPAHDDTDLAMLFADELGGKTHEKGNDAEFGSDDRKANGSSIAFLLEYPEDDPEVRILFAGDAWPSVLETSIGYMLPEKKTFLNISGFKIPHHGSVANLSAALLGRIKSKHYLVSTSGAKFRHPHPRAIELLLSEHNHKAKPRLHFNYLTKTTEAWSDEETQKKEGFSAFHPKGIYLKL